jgi:large subunit ribosomal protein L17
MLANMACSLIEHKRITTTLAKAKAIRVYLEPLVTKSKTDSMHNRRTVFSYLKNKYAVAELFREVGPKVLERNGGYLRIIKLGTRLGDAAEMAMVEFVDFNELLLAESGSGAGKKKRSRRGGKKATAAVAEAAVEAVEEKVEEAKPEEVKPEAEAKAEPEAKVDEPAEETKKESEDKSGEEE